MDVGSNKNLMAMPLVQELENKRKVGGHLATLHWDGKCTSPPEIGKVVLGRINRYMYGDTLYSVEGVCQQVEPRV